MKKFTVSQKQLINQYKEARELLIDRGILAIDGSGNQAIETLFANYVLMSRELNRLEDKEIKK